MQAEQTQERSWGRKISAEESARWDREYAARDARFWANLCHYAQVNERAWLASCGVPPRLRIWGQPTDVDDATGGDVDLIPNKITDWTQSWSLDRQIRGALILAGPTGSGKTATAVWVLTRAYRYVRRPSISDAFASWPAPSAQFVRVADLYAAVTASAVTPESRALLRQAARVEFLVLDDLGATNETDARLGALDDLIDARYVSHRPRS